MANNKSVYREIIKSFFLSFKRLSLYAVDHPLSREILNNLFKMFDAFLKENQEILFVVGINEGEMLVNQEALTKDVMGVAEIYAKFKGFKLDGVSFEQGLTFEELTGFIVAMASSYITDAGKAAPIPELLKQGSQNVKIKKIHYEKVEEDQKVVSIDMPDSPGPGEGLGSGSGGGIGSGDGSAGIGSGDGFGGPGVPGGQGGRANASMDIKNFLTGKNQEIGGGAQGVFELMDRDVSGVAEAIIESAKESGDFEAVIKKFVGWLAKNVTPILVEKKKDPAKFIQKLFDSFKKGEGAALFPSSDAVIEECSDEIKTAMVQDAFSLYKASPKKAVNVAVKILGDEDDQNKILPKLKERFTAAGVASDEADSFIQKTKTELAKDEEVPISKKKLAKLMRLSERFEEEMGQKVQIATEGLRRHNKRLSDEKERSESIMRHLADGLVVVDRAGNVVMMNPAAEKLLGRGTKEALGRSLVEGLKEEHLMAVAKGPLDDKDEAHITKEIEVSSKDETTKKVLRASSAVVENEDGKTVGMVSVLSDITREKEVEEMKSHFVSLVTHELRTPVVAIQKSLELILSKTTGAINEDQERFLSISKFNLERLNRLINDLLDMSKIEAGKLTLKPEAFDFRDIVNEVVSLFNSWAKDKEITIHLDLKQGSMAVTLDRDRMTQVLVNLVGNALKFTPVKGEITVMVDALERREGICAEPCLEVTVVDNGIGIDPKDFKRIFNKFEQVRLVSPSGVGGTGLGLSIAKGIISLHGGAIRVESQIGKGSRFIFVTPKVLKTS
ncbi:MAG: ATP-binding protein [Candidatus Omnitrophota bacterium]